MVSKNFNIFYFLTKILISGESADDIRERLIRLETEQPDLKEGWNNELETAYQDVDNELIKVISSELIIPIKYLIVLVISI